MIFYKGQVYWNSGKYMNVPVLIVNQIVPTGKMVKHIKKNPYKVLLKKFMKKKKIKSRKVKKNKGKNKGKREKYKGYDKNKIDRMNKSKNRK